MGKVRHGHAYANKPVSRTYQSWCHMKSRCLNPKHHAYHRYGGRGITVCQWWSYFENFLGDMGERPEGTSIDRIDNDGDYEPGNCKWSTREEQNANRLSQAGEGNPATKTTWAVVRAMRELYKRKCPVTQARLGKWFRMSTTNAGDILRRKIWKE